MNDEIEIESEEVIEGIEQVHACIKRMILTPRTSMPGHRGFGLDMDFFDINPEAALNMIAIDLAEKALIYLPEIEIQSVEGEADEEGKLHIKVTIGRRE